MQKINPIHCCLWSSLFNLPTIYSTESFPEPLPAAGLLQVNEGCAPLSLHLHALISDSKTGSNPTAAAPGSCTLMAP